MTTDTLIFKQDNSTDQSSLLATAARLIGKLFQRNPAFVQGNDDVRPKITPGDVVYGMFSPGCDGQVIFHLLAGGMYPTRKLF